MLLLESLVFTCFCSRRCLYETAGYFMPIPDTKGGEMP